MNIKRFLGYLIIISVPFLAGCKKDSRSDDQKPVINSITVTPESATPGETVTLTVNASDPQGNMLSYLWSVSQGTLSDPAKPSTELIISPIAQVNSYSKILLTVSDGTYSSTSEKEIFVDSGVTVSGKANYSGTNIPVSGLRIKLGPYSTITSSDGLFVFLHITPGIRTIEAEKSGFDNFVRTENITSSNNVFTIGITSTTETRMVSGTVKTVDNILLKGIRVVMLNDDRTESTLIDTTDLTGHYEIRSVPTGTRTFKFSNANNPNNCQPATYDIVVNNPQPIFDAALKMERNIDMLQNGWEFASADLSAPFSGISYVLTSDNTDGNRYFRPAYCCPIPADAENPVVLFEHKLTGTLRVPGGYFYLSPASAQIYMNSDCTTWVDYRNSGYTYWSYPISSFHTDRYIGNSFKGKSVKITLGLYRYHGVMPRWEIKSLVVNYYY
jgi:hypothetical protein